MPRPVGTSRTCLRCGEFLPAGTCLSAVYCPDCRKKTTEERLAKMREEAARKREAERAANQELRDREYCRSCRWYGSIYYGNNLCDYMLRTGKRRNCKAGEGCTMRVARRKRNELAV